MQHYGYRVTWSPNEKEYVGLCPEFPLLSHFDATAEAAFKGIMELVAGIVGDMLEQGQTPPERIPEID